MLEEIFSLIDSSIEFYLTTVIEPFVSLHEKFYSKLNTVLRDAIDAKGLPKWCTANFITYARTVLIVPCLMLLAMGHNVIPAFIVVLVDFADFLDGVVARYWVDEKKKAEGSEKTNGHSATYRRIPSWVTDHRNKTYGGFIDAICDKAFAIPCWIFLLSRVEGSALHYVQYIVLWFLILAETASGCIRFRAYFTTSGVPVPSMDDFNFASSAVKADHVGKAKQTFEMVGTTFFIFPFTHLIGLLILIPAVPLAYESVRRKITNRVIYVDGTVTQLDHSVLKLWMQAKGMGSKLIVGVSEGGSQDMISNACACSAVTEVMPNAPTKVDVAFLDENKINFVVCLAGKSGFVDEDILNAKRCIAIRDDDSAFAVEAKGVHKD